MKKQLSFNHLIVVIGLLPGLLAPTWSFASACFNCHKSAEFKGRVTHPPVAEQRCERCHNPHASRHSGLLLKEQRELCYGCHRQTETRMNQSKILHQPVKEGACASCHTAHASEFSGLLVKAEAELCFGCHKQAEKSYAHPHQPYRDGQCGACHSPHGGDDYRQLKTTGSGLCLGCHKAEAAMKKAHLGRDSQALDCLGCHHPHGGKGRSLLREVEHAPFAKGDCRACHGKSPGIGVCLGCHRDVLKSFNHVHSHLQSVAGGNPCSACHNPHVGDRSGLLPANEGAGCRSCHEGTFSRRAKMLHQHPSWNKCSDCHDLHGSDWPGMVKKSPEEVCAGCHQEHKKFSHPQGDKAPDPRNGIPMNCMTCHEANTGTMYKHFLKGSAERGLCVQCHLSY